MNFIIILNKLYDMWLSNKFMRVSFKFVWFLLSPILFFSGHWFLAILNLVFMFVWFNYFTFPFKKQKQMCIIMGPPGSGKTTFAAFISKWCNAINERCFSNIALKNTYKFSWSTDIGTYLVDNGTVIIDEASLENGLNNREFKKNFQDANFRRLEVCKLHRHFGLDCYFFSQWDDVDIKIRELAQQYFVLKKTPFNWLIKIKLYTTDIDLDPMTQDFRKVRIKKHTYFLFSPVVWLAFDTEEVPFELKYKDFVLR